MKPKHWPSNCTRLIRSASRLKRRSWLACWNNVPGSRSPTIQCALVFAGEGWHRGVVGIVASRLVERFCRPVFVLSQEDGEAVGSGRSIAAFHLMDALESMPDLFSRFGGHKQAAGLRWALRVWRSFALDLTRMRACALHRRILCRKWRWTRSRDSMNWTIKRQRNCSRWRPLGSGIQRRCWEFAVCRLDPERLC